MCENQRKEASDINNNISVSVIIPVYNACEYLRPALDSVIGQSMENIEIICIDDGSTDCSLEIVMEYQKRDPRVRIITETNAGPALARNNGLKRARGEYVIFLDADDFFEPNLILHLYERAKRDELDITIAGYDVYNSKKGFFAQNNDIIHLRLSKIKINCSKN